MTGLRRHRARRLTARLAVGALTIGLAAPLSAQETREEEIARLQAEKAAHLHKPEPTRAERITRRILGPPGPVYAWAGTIYSGGRIAVGAGADLPAGDTARFNARAGISLRDYRLLEAGFRFPDPVRDRVTLTTYVRRIDAPRVRFFEPGGDLQDARDTRFEFTPTTLGLAGDVHLTRDLTAGVAVERLDANVRWLNPSDQLVQLASGDDTVYGVLRASLRADTRDAPGYSTRGGLYRVEWSTFGDRAAGGPASFRRTELEAVQLIPIARAHWIIALRGLMTTTDTDEGETIPFFMLPSLGGGSTLRGYHSWRFRDRHRVLLSGEYRWTAGQLV
ncbi:MAG TPA: BamA/TamA family outer membrane protein, partial [Vicinamibacterales bacterium]